MATFGERLKELREEAGLTQKQLADIIGVTRPTMSFYESDERYPRKGVMEAITDYFNVDQAYIDGKQEIKRLVDLTGTYEAGVQFGRKETLKEISKLIGDGTFTSSFTAVPVYSDISCGTGTWVDEIPEDYVGIPAPLINQSCGYFSNRATGDSMEPGIMPGDYLVFGKSICVFRCIYMCLTA